MSQEIATENQIEQALENAQKATERQKIAFKKVMTKIANGQEVNLGEIMLDSGFSEATAKNPTQNLTSSVGWKELKSYVDEAPLFARLYDIALNGKENNAIKAIKEWNKLNDNYPVKKSKVDVAIEQRQKYMSKNTEDDDVEVVDN